MATERSYEQALATLRLDFDDAIHDARKNDLSFDDIAAAFSSEIERAKTFSEECK